MEGGIAKSFKYFETAQELWESIEAAYAEKRNNARILELKMEIANFKQGTLSIGDYYSKFRSLWIELESCMSPDPCAKNQTKFLEDQHKFELLGVLTKSMNPFTHKQQARIPCLPLLKCLPHYKEKKVSDGYDSQTR